MMTKVAQHLLSTPFALRQTLWLLSKDNPEKLLADEDICLHAGAEQYC